jgi:hypothetical protein
MVVRLADDRAGEHGAKGRGSDCLSTGTEGIANYGLVILGYLFKECVIVKMQT